MRNIKAFVTDVDGCMTDGNVHMFADGNKGVSFNTHDGLALSLLREHGIPIFAISGRNCKSVGSRLNQLKFTGHKLGSENKLTDLAELLSLYNIKIEEVAYMGDDLIDYEVMQRSLVSYAPNNACPEVKEIATHICSENGGAGAVRKAIENMLNLYFNTDLLSIFLAQQKSPTQ